MKLKKKEAAVLLIILAAAVMCLVIPRLLPAADTGMIKITAAGEPAGTFSLDKDQVINIGDTNICEIKNGEAKMTSSDCPDKLCIHQHPVGKSGGMIICLPNRVVIEGIPAKDSETENDQGLPALDVII